MTVASSSRIHPGVFVLALTAFAIGVAEFIVVGILPSISADLGVPLATAGGLLVVFGVATLIGNLLGGKLADRMGWQRALRLLFVPLAAVLVPLVQLPLAWLVWRGRSGRVAAPVA